ncbi:MAG: acyltransferase [Chloroflexota bacterium]
MQSDHYRLHGLDHLRATAILGVMLYHYRALYGLPIRWLEPIGRIGWAGVDLFFVLSGFLIARKLFEEVKTTDQINLGRFYISRALRILPAYWSTLAIYFFLPVTQEGAGIQPLWRFLTFTQNFNFNPYRTTFSHAWSLSVEEHFYLLFPLLLLLVFRQRWRLSWLIFPAVLMLGIGLRWWAWRSAVAPMLTEASQLRAAFVTVYYPTYTRLDGLLVGVGLAAIATWRPDLIHKLHTLGDWLLPPALACLGIAFWLFGGPVTSPYFATLPTLLFGFPILSIGFGLLVLAAINPNSFWGGQKFAPSYGLATISYAIYLIHKIINHMVNTLVVLNTVSLFLLSFFLTIAAGAVLYTLIESHFLRFRTHPLAKAEKSS